MKSHSFEYVRPKTVTEAVDVLSQAAGEGRVLAGGQTLGPMLNMRLAMPRLLVDIGGIPELRRIEPREESILVGATVTHATFEDWNDPTPLGRLMTEIGGSIAYRAIRNRGTIGGSLCHADPAADWVTVMSLLGARVVIAGGDGRRHLRMPDFIFGTFATALNVGELVEAIEIPRISANARWGYYRVCRKVGEFPEAIGAVLLDPTRGISRVISGAMDGKPLDVWSIAEQLARTGAVPALEVVDATLADMAPDLDAIDRQLHAAAIRRAAAKALA